VDTNAIRSILLATDLSAASETATQVAADLARQLGARLHILHVTDLEEVAVGWVALDDLGARLRGDSPISLMKAVEVGEPAARITDYAGRYGIDLIVMGTHGRTGILRLARGSVAEAVVRSAPCQVLTVRPGAPKSARLETAASAKRCMVCAEPRGAPVCDLCSRQITAEARERKLRDLRAH
jgi:nucleotide-binding universal stress UspA family protein